MKSKTVATMLTLVAAAAAFFATPFIGMADAEARQNGKSLKCVARAVPGQVGVRIWSCSSIRI